jgi:hypothetical protein
MAGINAERTAMGRDFLHIKNDQPGCFKNFFNRKKREIVKMFMVDRIKLVFLY